MASLRENIIMAVMIGLFVFAFISFGTQLSLDNDTNNSVLDNDVINRSFFNIQSELSDTIVTAEGQRESFFKDVPIIGEISLFLKSITGVTRVFFSTLINFYNLFTTLIAETMGVSTIILNGMVALVLISTVLLAWSVYRSGQ